MGCEHYQPDGVLPPAELPRRRPRYALIQVGLARACR
jgi:hypothetical protein